jgi:serine/threonine protein kinase
MRRAIRARVQTGHGARLGPYEIDALIGAGGMGEVYRATDTRLRRTVAIKTIAHRLQDRQDVRGRFKVEAEAIAALAHPHICQIYDIGQQDPSAGSTKRSMASTSGAVHRS